MSELQTMAPELDPVKMAELLRLREAGESFPQSFIREEDPYSAAPEDLVQGAPGTDRGEGKGVAWYYCWRAEWHGSAGGGSSSKRKRKVTVAGEATHWHPETGKQAIIGTDGKPVGAYKRTLSYIHKIRNPPGMATSFTKKRLGWSMLEIGLDDPDQGLVLCKLYRTHQAHTNPEISTETSVPCPALEPAPSGAEIEVSRVAIVRNGSAAGAAVTIVIDLCGSSIQPTQRLKDLANNVRGLESPAVVVSAMGNTTNIILMAACKALRCGPEKVCEIHEVMLIKELYLRTIRELGLEASTALGSLDLLERQLQHIAMNKRLTFSIRDYLVSFGEITSTKIFSDYLNKLEGTVQVWKLHAIATSGRGSSTHLTATTIDIALESREIQVWKDVDGIFSCDPKVCADATLVPCLTFDEAAELSDFAEQSMKQVMEYGRSIRVMNPYNPLVRGTVITETRDTSESALTSISLKSNITVLDIKSNRMLFQTDFVPTALSKFQHFEYLGISVDCKVTLDGKVKLTLIPSGLLSKELIKLELDNVVEELEKIAEVHRLEDKSVIFLIGNAQKSSSIQQRALSVLWRINAEVYKFWQESSKVMKVSLVVDRSRAKDCVQALHSAFFEKGLVSEDGGAESIPQVPVCSPAVAVAASISAVTSQTWQETCSNVPLSINDTWSPGDNPCELATNLCVDDELMPVGIDKNDGALDSSWAAELPDLDYLWCDAQYYPPCQGPRPMPPMPCPPPCPEPEPSYRRAKLSCSLQKGRAELSSFWRDTWLGSEPLCGSLSALFSHSTDKDATVREVLDRGLRCTLVPRLNAADERQLPQLTAALARVSLSDQNDARTLLRCGKKSGGLDAGEMYKLLMFGGVDAPFHDFVWINFAPSKVKFFAWLLSLARIQTRSSLLRKKILTPEEASCPICDDALETPNHLLFECEFAKSFWGSVGFRIPAEPDVCLLYSYLPRLPVPKTSRSTFLLLCCWELWKHRNAVVFREQRPCLPLLIRTCRTEAQLWSKRLPPALVTDLDAWLACLRTSEV